MISGGSAVLGTDFAPTSGAMGVIQIPPGSLTATIGFNLIPDTLDEVDEQFSVSLSAATNATVAGFAATVTIADDDAPPSLSVADATGAEGAGTVAVPVSLSAASGKTVAVNFATADNTAVNGQDYSGVSGTITFPPGATSGSIDIGLLDDLTDEPDRQFAFALSAPSNASIADGSANVTVADDDAPPVLTASEPAVAENAGTAVVTLTLSAASAFPIAVDFATADAGAVAGDDYVTASGTASIPAGATSTTVPVTILDDALDEAEEAFALNLTNPQNVSLAAPQALVTIADDDPEPALSVADASAAESAGVVGTVVSLSAPSGREISVDYATADGTASEGADYAAASGTVTIPAGDTSAPVAVSLVDDASDEFDEDFQIVLSSPSNASLADAEATLVIADDDAPPSLDLLAASAAEGEGAVNVTVLVSEPSGKPITVNYATADGTALAGADYAVASDSLAIPAGAASATFAVTLLDDALDESDESFAAQLSDPVNASLGSASANFTIVDDDEPPAITVAAASAAENAGSLSFAVTLSAPSALEVRFDYATADGDAAAGLDYAAASGTAIIPPGQTAASVVVPLLDDALDEGDESLSLALSDPVNAALSAASATGTITDDDPLPVVSIAGASAAEDGGTLGFVASLDPPSGREVTVAFSATDGSATAADYALPAGTATFAPGETSAAIVATLVADALDEPDETFAVTLGGPVNAVLGTASAIGTILDDDAAPTLTAAAASAGESDGTLTFILSLDAPSGQPVAVDFATADGTALTGGDYVAAAAQAVIAAGETEAAVAITILPDALDEPDESFSLALSNIANATLGTASAEGLILDDDDPPSISVADVSASEEDGTVIFAVSLSAPSGRAVSFDFATADGTASAGADYVLAGGSRVIPAGETAAEIVVALLGDALDEDAESFTLGLSNLANAAGGDVEATAMLTDDDAPPVLSLAGGQAPESAGPIRFVATLDAPSGKTVTANFASADGTAEAGIDYAGASGSIQILPGETEAFIDVALLDDALFEDNETFTVTLSAPANASLGIASAAGTILDDEAEPVISAANVSAPEGGSALVFTIQLSHTSGVDVTFDYAAVSGSAVAGEDFAAAAGSGLIPAGQTQTQIEVVLLDDALDENPETFALALTNVANALPVSFNATGTITDDDEPPVLTIADAQALESGALVFNVALDAPSGRVVEVDFATSDGTALGGVDFSTASGRLSILAGETAATITVTPIDDALDEFDESLGIALSNASGATLSDAEAVGVIEDDDAPVSVSLAPVAVAEGAGAAEVAVTLSGASGKPVAVEFSTADGTAVAGSDYAAAISVPVAIPAGETSAAVSIPVLEDALDEADESFGIALASPANATLGTASAAVTILDNDGPPSISISGGTSAEGSGSLAFTLALSEPSGQAVTVSYASGGGTAAAGDDYAAVSGSATIPAGETEAQVSVPLVDDLLDEDTETVVVTLTNPQNAALGAASATGTIDDDDAPPAISVADASAAEGAGSLSFAVSLSAPSGREVRASYSLVAGTAEAPADFAPVGGTVVIPAGGTGAAISVPVVSDALDEDDESLSVELADLANATAGTVAAEGTIVDDDDPPTLSLADVEIAEGAGSAAVIATLSAASGREVRADFAAVAGSAAEGDDFGSAAGALIFAPGETAKQISLTIFDDALDEAAESFSVVASNFANAAAGGDATVTITDNDDPPAVSLAGPGSVAEGDLATFFVSLSAPSGLPVSVDYVAESGAAVAGDDFSAASGTLAFAPGETSKAFSVATLDDALDEDDEGFSASLSAPVNAALGVGSAGATIADNDAPPVVSVADAAASENAGSVVFAVSLSAPSGRPVRIDYATAAGSAVEGTDFSGASGTLVFSAGETEKAVAVSITDDALDEFDESFALSLTNPQNAAVGEAVAAGTILDDDALPALAASGAATSEGAGQAVVMVALSAISGRDVSVNYATENGSAVAPEDFGAVSGTLTIPAGEASGQVIVPLIDDALDESDEAFVVRFADPQFATLDGAEAAVTIIDNDAPPQVLVTGGTVGEGEAQAVFSISLSAASGLPVSVGYATVVGSAGAADFTGVAGTATIPAGETSAEVAVAVLEDALDEPDETFSLALADPVNATLGAPSAAFLIADNDDPPALSVAATQASEGSGSLVFQVSLSAPSGYAVAADFALASGSALVGEDFAPAGGSVSIPAGQTEATVSIPLVDDALDEPDESFSLTLVNPSHATLGSASATGTILDDDDQPALSVAAVAAPEASGTIEFFIALSAPSGREVRVNYATAGGSAGSPTDFAAASGTAVIAPGLTSFRVPVAVAGDVLFEADESFTLSLSDPLNATIAQGTATGTIQNDDAAPEISVADISVGESGGAAVVTISLSAVSGLAAAVDLSTIAASAVEGADFVAVSQGVAIPAGETAVSVPVAIVGDALDEIDETFLVLLANPVGAVFGEAQATVTILDDDAMPELSIAGGSVPEGGGAFVFALTLSAPSGREVFADAATVEGTAVSGADFVGIAGEVSLAEGETSETLSVLIAQDSEAEADESFALQLTNPVGVALAGSGSATATILDDDFAAAFGIKSVVKSAPGKSQVGWQGVAGRLYTLERSLDLDGWEDVPGATGVVGTGGQQTFEDPDAPAGSAFYRIRDGG
ncbi:MAG: Calx-beta domain-containing protein [Verrucomicrobiales bacterium]